MSSAALLMAEAGLVMDEVHDAAIDELPDDILEALTRVAPSVGVDTLNAYPDSALQGLAYAVKGALFELQVGQAVASREIPIPPGASFRLVEDFSTPGYDAVVTGSDGVEELIQLKASATADIIARHFTRHPDVTTVWTTSEAAADAARRGLQGVADTGITDASLAGASAAVIDQAHVSLAEVLDEIVPQFTLAIIGVQAGWRLLQGDPPTAVFEAALGRAKEATLTSALSGLLATATGTDAVRFPTVIAVGLGRAAVVESRDRGRRVDRLTAIVAGMRP